MAWERPDHRSSAKEFSSALRINACIFGDASFINLIERVSSMIKKSALFSRDPEKNALIGTTLPCRFLIFPFNTNGWSDGTATKEFCAMLVNMLRIADSALTLEYHARRSSGSSDDTDGKSACPTTCTIPFSLEEALGPKMRVVSLHYVSRELGAYIFASKVQP